MQRTSWRRLIRRSAPHFVLTQALENERIYQEVTQSNILRISPKAVDCVTRKSVTSDG